MTGRALVRPMVRQFGVGGGSSSNIVISGVPTISGTPTIGETLTASPATATGTPTPSRSWQWYRNGVAISGATSITYTLVSADGGKNISVQQIETNLSGSAAAVSVPVSLTLSPASLFAAGELGAWLRPNDLSTVFLENTGVTQASAAGQTVGLVNSQGNLGPNLVTNGDFASGVTGWNPFGSTQITWVAGQMRVTANSGNIASQSIAVPVGKAFLVQWDGVNVTSSQARMSLGTAVPNGIYGGFDGSAVGRRAVVWDTTGSNLFVQAAPQPNTNGLSADYDNISVRLLPLQSAFQVTSGNRPTLRQGANGVYYLEDVSSDTLTWNAPAGTYTVAYVIPNGTVTILTGQSLSGVTNIMLASQIVEYIAVNRALTPDETSGVTAYLEGIANP